MVTKPIKTLGLRRAWRQAAQSGLSKLKRNLTQQSEELRAKLQAKRYSEALLHVLQDRQMSATTSTEGKWKISGYNEL